MRVLILVMNDRSSLLNLHFGSPSDGRILFQSWSNIATSFPKQNDSHDAKLALVYH